MLQLTPQTRIFVAIESVDFRKGIDGLAAVCRVRLTQDPMSGALFLFRNKTKTTIRILSYDGQGFWLCTKRLSKGKYTWWPDGESSTQISTIDCRELQTLLWNGNPSNASFTEDWRKISIQQ